jgi:hypothetical protein
MAYNVDFNRAYTKAVKSIRFYSPSTPISAVLAARAVNLFLSMLRGRTKLRASHAGDHLVRCFSALCGPMGPVILALMLRSLAATAAVPKAIVGEVKAVLADVALRVPKLAPRIELRTHATVCAQHRCRPRDCCRGQPTAITNSVCGCNDDLR